MASLWRKRERERERQTNFKPGFSLLSKQLLVLVSLLAVALIYYLRRGDSTLIALGGGLESVERMNVGASGCDFSSGKWVYDPDRRAAYNESCSDIFKGWNCIRNRRANAGEYLHWRWQPDGCELPRMNPREFLTRFRGKNIGFVGDSLNRNMYVSLVCTLKQAGEKQLKKWRPLGADKGITFLGYNLTVAYHRTNLLARLGEWKADSSGGGALEKLGFKQGFRVDVDVPQSSWSQPPQFYDVLIINTGHWWFAPEKFNPVSSPLLFFEAGKPILPPRTPEEGLDITLNYMLDYVESNMKHGGIKLLRTQSPRHFEGGDWKDGGKCHRDTPLSSSQVEEMFSRGVNSEARIVNKHLARALSSSRRRSSFRLLDITKMSEFRGDGHPSTSAKKVHEDCMHWCLPGVTDSWNDLLAAIL